MGIIETQSAGKVSELFDSIAALVPGLAAEAATFDRAAEFPRESMAKLQHAGLLMAPVPVEFGGFGLHQTGDAKALFRLLHRLGYADLPLGRIFEAHVNALELIRQYGTRRQMEAGALAAQAGDLFALWVTDPPQQGVQLAPDLILAGEKWFCSAAGAAKQALITAGNQMLVVPITPSVRVTERGVKLAGMRAATTGSVDLTGINVQQESLIGDPGDYLREPTFSTGAWRSSAVALGGLAALIETTRERALFAGPRGQPIPADAFRTDRDRARDGTALATRVGQAYRISRRKRSGSLRELGAYRN
jgi:alkylation response protein AidB-like acyl-CoA dehydrogenase